MTRRGWSLPAGLAGALAAAALGIPPATPASADGGLVRARAEQDGLTVTLFTDPTPLRAGPADVSVLVQNGDRMPVLDAAITVRLASGDGVPVVASQPLSHEEASNKLLQAARVVLPAPGRWRLTAEVRRGDARATVAADVDVAPATGRAGALWPVLAVPPVAVALYAVHQTLRRRRRA